MPDQPAMDEIAPWMVRLARVGYAAKAVLYATVGGLAAQAALGSGGRTTDSHGALRTVLSAPFGRTLLFIAAAGLVGYSFWCLVEAVLDPERRGTGLKAVALRLSYAVRGVVHVGLALAAFRLAAGLRSGGGEGAERWTSRAFDLPAGVWLVWLVAAGFVGYGVYQLYRAFASKLSRRLDLSQLPASVAYSVVAVSRFGIAARGVVFGLIGILLARAAAQHDAGEAGGVGDSLRAVGNIGRWPLIAVALGLVAYGVYELMNARYRRIRMT